MITDVNVGCIDPSGGHEPTDDGLGVTPGPEHRQVAVRRSRSEFSVLIPKTGRTPCWAGGSFGADDEIRTRDPHLGKVMLYQLSYVRVRPKR